MVVSRIFWDTNLFIYLIEDAGGLSDRVAALRRRMLERSDRLYTSSLTLGEVLVKPLETGNEELKERYEKGILAGAVVVPFDTEAALRYAEIRRDHSIRPPDAVQLACAARVGTDLFITNDDRLAQKSVRGIHFVAPLHRAYL